MSCQQQQQQPFDASANCMSLAEIVRNQEGIVVTPPDEKENVIYIDSFFIPHVFEYITLDRLVEMIETPSPSKGDGDTSIGIVDKIESIPKINQKDGHPYYSCFVTLKSWANNGYARTLMYRLYNDEQIRLYYESDKYRNDEYIVLLPNKSETSMMEAPKHTDLVLYLHSDISMETVLNIMQGLDIGQVHSIETELISQPHSNNTYYDSSFKLWEGVNSDIWNQTVNTQYNTVYVRFSYWYKTQTAYNFNREMIKSTFVDVPVFNGTVWTFFETTPKYDGVNPYVWQR
jgi:hypothetical protein